MSILVLLIILLPFVGGIAAQSAGKRKAHTGWAITVAVTFAELALSGLLLLAESAHFTYDGVCGLGITFSVTGLQIWLCMLAGFLWLVSALFSGEYFKADSNSNRYFMFLLMTEGAIMGVFLSADLFTTLIFFETMSFASYPLVVHRETPQAIRAGASYLTYAVIGGMASLMGLFLLWTMFGTLSYDGLLGAAEGWSGSPVKLYVTGVLALITFAAKVCMFPLHTWLPNSYAEAPSPATALLSGIITKAGVFGIFGLTAKLFYADASWGKLIVVCGIITALVGGTLALFNTNLKQTIAYSSMSQIGFILVGTGMTALLGEENIMAVWGSVLHLTNHSLIKLVLLLVGGVIVYNVGELDYNTIRGFGRGKLGLMFAFLMPALGVMGVPLWNGYISKTMIHESIVEYIEELELHALTAAHGDTSALHHTIAQFEKIEWLFLIAGGMTVAYMTKLFVCIFIEKNTDAERQAHYDSLKNSYAPKLWLVLLDGCALLFPLFGMLPRFTMDKIAVFAEDFFGLRDATSAERLVVDYFSGVNLKGAGISLSIGVLLYAVFVTLVVRSKHGYQNRFPKWLDLERVLYVPILFKVLPFIGAMCARIAGSLFEWATALVNKVLFFRYDKYVHPEEDNYFARYRAKDPGVRGYRGQIAYGLALFGAGFVAVVLFLVLTNFIL